MKEILFRNVLCAALLMGGVLLTGTAHAQTWEGGVSDDWFDGANWVGGQIPPIGTGTITIDVAAPVVADGQVGSMSSNGTIIGATATGAMLTVRNGGQLTVNNLFGGRLLVIGRDAGASGSVRVEGAGSLLSVMGGFAGSTVFVGSSGNGVLTLANGGRFQTARPLMLAELAGSSGTLNIGAAAGAAAEGAGVIDATGISFGLGDGRLVFNHTGGTGPDDPDDYLFGTTLSGDGQVDVLAGNTVFTSNHAAFTGRIDVHDGATLRGQGNRIIGNANSTMTVLDGGRLAVGNGGANVMTIGGDLSLEQGAILNFGLGVNEGAPFGDVLIVNGDVNIDGAVLEVVDLGDFGDGTWTLIQFSGNANWTFADNLVLPGGLDGDIRLSEDGNAIILVVGGGVLEESWWAPGAVFGGDGVWDNVTENWTDEDGNVQVAWGGQVAVFAGTTAGEVSVEDEVHFTRLRFETDGYVLSAGADGVLAPNDDELGNAAPVIEVIGGGTTVTLDLLIDSGSRDNALRKDGDGTLVLTADQNYSGLTVIAGGGTLQLGDGGNSGMVSGDVQVQQSNTLAFNRADDVVFTHLISGAGRVEHLGDGTTTLTVNNTYTGRTVIENGTLQLGNGGGSGWIGSSIVEINGGALAINRSGSQTLGAEIRGAGDLVQMGSGALTLTANSSGFTGLTRVGGGSLRIANALGGDAIVSSGGTLFVDGSLGGDADVSGTLRLAGDIGGAVDVRSGGLLSGNGEIGGDLRIRDGGLLSLRTVSDSAGSGEPTLDVTGNLRFDEGARFEVGVNRFGNADWVQVAGQADLAGSVLVVEAGSPGATWQPFNEYVILVAGGGLIGEFDEEVVNDFAFLSPRLEQHNGHIVTLFLDRNDTRFGDLPGLTANQAATGMAIQGMEGLVGQDVEHPVVVGLLSLNPVDAGVALQQLSGEAHVSTRSMLLNDSAMVHDAVMAHAGSAANPGSRFWMRGLYHDGRFDGDGVSKFERSTSGLILGADYLLGSHGFTSGWAVGYHRSEMKAAELGSSGDSNAFHAAVYSGARWGAEDLPWSMPGGPSVGLRAGIGHSWHEIDLRRTVGLIGEDLRADYDATSLQLAVEADLRFRLGDSEIAPFLGATWVRLSSDGFVEEAGDTQPVTMGETAALQGASGSDSLGLATLGVRGSTVLGKDMHGDQIRLHGMLGWRHVLDGRRPEASLRLRDSAPGDAFMTITGAPLASSALLADLGLRIRLGDSTSFGVSWVSQVARDVTDHAVQARFEWLLD